MNTFRYLDVPRSFWLLFVCVAIGVVLPAALRADDKLLERVPELERRVVDARLAIKSCELKIARTDEYPDRPAGQVEKRDFDFLISGNKVFLTVSFPNQNPPKRTIFCRNCEADGFVMDLQDADPKVPATVSFAPIAKLPPKSLNDRIPEPRTLGLIPDRFGSTAPQPIDSVVGRKDRKNLTAVMEKLDGRDAVRVSYRYRDFANVTYWIVPELGHSVARMEFRTDSGSLNTVVVRPKRCEPSGIWYPESMDYSESVKGKPIFKMNCAIEIKSMNESIDAPRFALPAQGLSPGTRIYEIPPTFDRKKWTGASLVDLDEKDNQLEPAPLPLKSDNKWLIRGAVVLAAAALIVGLQLLRRRFAAKG